MNTGRKNHSLALGAVIGALYAAMTYAQELLIPGSASMAVQFRISEALMLLCVFTPAAIPGLTVGCFFANLLFMGALPVDVIFGTGATFLAGVCVYKLRNITFRGAPVLSALMPAVFNGIIIGLEIEIFFIEGAFHFSSFMLQAGLVALGELTVCMSLGLLLVKIIKGKKIEKYL